MLSVLNSIENCLEKSILVNPGYNAVGQAVISVALAAEISVYITVENEEQAKLLKKKFPSVRNFFKRVKHEYQINIKNYNANLLLLISY